MLGNVFVYGLPSVIIFPSSFLLAPVRCARFRVHTEQSISYARYWHFVVLFLIYYQSSRGGLLSLQDHSTSSINHRKASMSVTFQFLNPRMLSNSRLAFSTVGWLKT